MNKFRLSRMMIVHGIDGVVSETTNENVFALCCIGHAQQVALMLKKRELKFAQAGVIFTFPSVFEPRMTAFVMEDKQCTISFDRNVGNYIFETLGHEIDADDWQQVVETLEMRVIKGIFGDVLPRGIGVRWEKEQLIVYWK